MANTVTVNVLTPYNITKREVVVLCEISEILKERFSDHAYISCIEIVNRTKLRTNIVLKALEELANKDAISYLQDAKIVDKESTAELKLSEFGIRLADACKVKLAEEQSNKQEEELKSTSLNIKSDSQNDISEKQTYIEGVDKQTNLLQ